MAHTAPAVATALTFHSTTFDVIDRNGRPWLRGTQIGDALGYKKAGRISIQKLYDSNAAEFTDSMTAVVRLPTAGGMQDVRIFSLRGAHLLGMFARTKVAAEFRRWALDVLDTQVQPELSVQPGQFITAAQAGELSTLIAGRFPDGHDRPYAWGRFNNHFRIARYRELPATRFAEACAYIGSMQPKALPAPNLSALPAEALAAARKLALDYFDAIQAGEKNPRVGEIPEEVLTGIVANMLMNNRWLVSFDPFSGRMNTLRIDPAAFMVTAEQLPGLIREPLNIPAKTLFDIQAACHERIRNKFGAMEEARFIANAKR